MKLTFAYDGTLYQDNNGLWYGRNYASLSERYHVLSNEITYLMRTRIDDSVALKLSKMPSNTNVVSVPDFLSIRSYLNNYSKAIHVIENQIRKSDCVIVRLPGIISRVALKYAIKYKKPYIVEVVGCVWDSLIHHSFKGKLLAPIEFFKTKQAIKKSSYVMYVTNEFLQRRYPSNGKTIGISDVLINTICEEDYFSNSNIGNNRTIVIGTAGAIDVKYKGQEYVIKAMSKIMKESNKTIIYRIAGGGDSSRLNKIAEEYNVKDYVKFDGSIPNYNMSNWYDSLDIYIQPSTVEGMPRALIEAMSRGVICFGSRVGGIPELLSDDCLFKIGNVNEISNKIENIDNNKRNEILKFNFQKIREFDFKLLNDKRNKFYSDFLRDNGWK